MNKTEMENAGEGASYDKYVCDDNAIKEALNGSFSIVNGFKDKPSARIDVPRYVYKGETSRFTIYRPLTSDYLTI